MRGIIYSLIGIIVGLLAWRVLIWRSNRSALTGDHLLWILISVGLVCRVAFALGTPDFYAPDEQAHFNYIKFLVEHQSFPVQFSKTGAATNDWEYYQPPLYYLTQAPIYWLSSNAFSSDSYVLRSIRLGSVGIWLLGILFAWRFIRLLGIKSDSLKVVVIGMMSLLPTYTFLSAMINNDNLVVCIGCALLCVLVRLQFTSASAALVGFLFGLAALTKFSAFLYAPLIAFFAFWHIFKRREKFGAVVSYMMIVTLVSVLIISTWVYRNYFTYGSLFAENVANVPHEWPSFLAGLIGTFENVATTFWSVSGIYNNVHSFFPVFGITLSIFSIWGLIYAAMRGRVWEFELDRAMLGIFALSIAINALLVMRFGLLYAQGQGRFFFPLLLPISLFVGVGLHSLRIKFSDVTFSGLFIAYGMSFTLFSLLSFPRI